MLPYLKRKLLESYQRRNGRASIFLADGRVEARLSRWVGATWATARFAWEIGPDLQSAASVVPGFLQRALAEQGMTAPHLSLYLPDHLVDYRRWAISDAFTGRRRREFGLWKAGQVFQGAGGEQAAHLFTSEHHIQYFRHHDSITGLLRQLEERALVARVHPTLHAFALGVAASPAPLNLMCLGLGRWWSHIAVVQGQLVFQRSHAESDVECVVAGGDSPAQLAEFAGLVRHFGKSFAGDARPAITVSEAFAEAVSDLFGESCSMVSVKEETVYKALHGIP